MREVRGYERLSWILADRAAPTLEGAPTAATKRVDTVGMLLEMLGASPYGELQPRDVNLGLSERGTRVVFQRATKAGLIEPTTEALHDPTRSYRLTAAGRRELARGSR